MGGKVYCARKVFLRKAIYIFHFFYVHFYLFHLINILGLITPPVTRGAPSEQGGRGWGRAESFRLERSDAQQKPSLFRGEYPGPRQVLQAGG